MEKGRCCVPGMSQCLSHTGAAFVFKITHSGFVIKNKERKEISFLANRKKAGDVRWFVAE